ncbi:putative leucine-rich repeat domain superfamily [Helianthus anomalus]
MDGRVVSVNLDWIQLTGEIKFSTLLMLKNLKNLSLSGNRLTGRMFRIPGQCTRFSI